MFAIQCKDETLLPYFQPLWYEEGALRVKLMMMLLLLLRSWPFSSRIFHVLKLCQGAYKSLKPCEEEEALHTSLLKMPLANFLNEEPLTLHVILTDHFNKKIARKIFKSILGSGRNVDSEFHRKMYLLAKMYCNLSRGGLPENLRRRPYAVADKQC